MSNHAIRLSRSRMPSFDAGDRDKPVDEAVEEAEPGTLLHGRDERVGVEAWILGDRGQEPRIRLEIHLMRRHPEHDRRRRPGRVPIGTRVARRAIQADARLQASAPRRPDRQVAGGGFVDEPQALVAVARPVRQLVGEHLGQHHPEPVRDADGLLGADGPVLELGDDVRGLVVVVHAQTNAASSAATAPASQSFVHVRATADAKA